jgi:outer membrane protein assembly factor BamB
MPQICRLYLLPFLFAGSLQAADWPQFLGPTRDGQSTEKGILKEWPKSGPRKLWERTIGSGYAGPAVAEGRLILFHRIDNDDIIECLDAKTGEARWKYTVPTGYVDSFGFDDGPRGVPTIAGGQVYALGAEGRLTCLDLASGRKMWDRDLAADFQLRQSYFGVGVAPLVEGDAVFVNVGAKNAGIVAFDRATGKEQWKISNDEASYSTPTVAEIGGKRRLVFLTREGLMVVDPVAGTVVHQRHFRSRMQASVNAATPLVADGQIFLSACYNTGALLLKTDGWQDVWKNDESMSNHYTTCVKVGDYLYGSHGRQEEGAVLRCVEWKTGKVMWTAEGFGCAWLIAVDGMLLAAQESGRIVLLEASPQGYREKGSFVAFPKPELRGKYLRSAPALAEGILYARDAQKLVAWKLTN